MSISYGGDYITDTDGGKLRPSSSVMRNRIINGAMVIDQRNAGASVTPTNGQYTLDRWKYYSSQTSKVSIQQNAGSVTPPAGYKNYLGVTSLSAYSVAASDYFAVTQLIEGFNMADLGYGAAGATTVTLSFWVRSSLTGTFGGSLTNDSANYAYPFAYTISVANTWEQKSITITGATAGTWLSTNGTGIQVILALGAGSTYSGTAGAWIAAGFLPSATGATSVVGTSGATFYITGVQLEVGSSATGFEYRQYTTELQLCQRYYETCFPAGTAPANGTHTGVYSDGLNGWAAYTTGGYRAPTIRFVVTKRSAPSVTFYNASNVATSGAWGLYNGSWNAVTTALANVQTDSFEVGAGGVGVTANAIYLMNGLWSASAEL